MHSLLPFREKVINICILNSDFIAISVAIEKILIQRNEYETGKSV